LVKDRELGVLATTRGGGGESTQGGVLTPTLANRGRRGIRRWKKKSNEEN